MKGFRIGHRRAPLLCGAMVLGSLALAVAAPAVAQTPPVEDLVTKRPWADVRAFGAKGDGSADDTAAIQAAINFAEPLHSVVYFPQGAYKITSRLRLPPNVSLEGVGPGFGSSIRPVSTDAITILGKDYRGGFGFRNRIKGLNIMMTHASASRAIHIDTAYSIKLEDLFVYGAGTAGGIVISNARHVSLEDVSVYGDGSGDGVSVRNSDVRSYDVDIEGVVNGLAVNSSQGVHIFGGHFERFGAYGIRFESSSFNSVIGVRLSGSNNGTIGVGFLDAGQGPSQQNTILASLLTNPATDATAVYQDARSHDNTIVNSLLEGRIKSETGPVAVFGPVARVSGVSISDGPAITGHLSAATLINFDGPSHIPQSLDRTVVVKGAAWGDTVAVGAPVSVGADYLLTAFVSGPDAVTIRWTQLAGAPSDPDGPGGLYRVDVWKHQ